VEEYKAMNILIRYAQRMMAVMALAMMLCLPSLVWSAEPAGFVLMATGEVHAVHSDQQIRKLKRKAPFYSGETLQTGDSSKAQVRFVDGSLISLRANTQIHIDEFHFNDASKGDDKNIFTLISGGFRTITGKIGKKNPKDYKMKSSVASIGVRGTTYEVVLLDGALNVAAWDGTIEVKNEAGMITLGAEGVFNFASVSSPVQVPEGMMKPPAAIADKQEVAMYEPQVGEKHSDENGDDQGLSERQITREDGKGDTRQVFGDGFKIDPVEEPTSPMPVLQSTCTTCAAIIDPNQLPDINVTFIDFLKNVNLDCLAMAVKAGPYFSGMLAGGKAGYDGLGRLTITDNGLSPGEAGFDTAAYIEILSQYTAPDGIAPMSYMIDSNHTVEFGVWASSSVSPAKLLKDPSDISVYNEITQPIFWGSAKPTLAMPGSGMGYYRNVLSFIGGGSGGQISNVLMSLDVDFNTAAADGLVHIYNGSDVWDISLAGGIVKGPAIDFSLVSGTVGSGGPVTGIKGEFNSLFTGDTAQALASSFDFEAISDPLIHVEGLVLVDDAAVSDLRLTGVQASEMMSHVGYYAFPTLNQLAHSSSGDGATEPVFGNSGQTYGDPDFYYPSFNGVYSSAVTKTNAGSKLVNGDPLYTVNWGVWDGDVENHFDASDNAVFTVISGPMAWMTFTPTHANVVGAKTGVITYDSPAGSIINDSFYGAVDNALTSFSATMNFDSNTLSSGSMSLTAGGNVWSATSFTGTIEPSGHVDVTSMDINLNGGPTVNTAQMDMLFTGPNAEALAGSFGLISGGSQAAGVFLVCQSGGC
jgi:hypothetical protein